MKKIKTTLYRFTKDTIKTMDWHFSIEITEGKYIFWKAHVRKDDYEMFKEEEKEITKEEAEKFISDNQAHLIEVRKSYKEIDSSPSQVGYHKKFKEMTEKEKTNKTNEN